MSDTRRTGRRIAIGVSGENRRDFDRAIFKSELANNAKAGHELGRFFARSGGTQIAETATLFKAGSPAQMSGLATDERR